MALPDKDIKDFTQKNNPADSDFLLGVDASGIGFKALGADAWVYPELPNGFYTVGSLKARYRIDHLGYVMVDVPQIYKTTEFINDFTFTSMFALPNGLRPSHDIMIVSWSDGLNKAMLGGYINQINGSVAIAKFNTGISAYFKPV